MLAVRTSVFEPPISYLQRPRKYLRSHRRNQAVVGCDLAMEVNIGNDRGEYNRLIGEMIQDEKLFQCDDQPSLDELGYSDEFFRSMSTVKKHQQSK